ncbi:MAG: hypothetical protein NVSMB27_48530 [Ktedonobacteraceae bacterium]
MRGLLLPAGTSHAGLARAADSTAAAAVQRISTCIGAAKTSAEYLTIGATDSLSACSAHAAMGAAVTVVSTEGAIGYGHWDALAGLGATAAEVDIALLVPCA